MGTLGMESETQKGKWTDSPTPGGDPYSRAHGSCCISALRLQREALSCSHTDSVVPSSAHLRLNMNYKKQLSYLWTWNVKKTIYAEYIFQSTNSFIHIFYASPPPQQCNWENPSKRATDSSHFVSRGV